ncbi:MAG: cytochrome c oxidase accessory protein CcoG [Planctomycetes bacterium]|nr:cytochrome c oxidase accessory protein CcoG [Planctomycetota bacterium]
MTDPEVDREGAPAAASGAVAKPKVHKGRAVVRRPDVDTLFSINPDGSRNAIHPADVRGRFQLLKHALWIVLIGVYLLVPWLRIDGIPVLLIDLPARHFYLLGQTFNAQDFWYAFFFISGLGFALFVAAGLYGRVWCGYACPQTVFLEGVFRRIERWIEGPAAARAKLDKAPLSGGKLVRRGLKLVVFFAIAAVITHSFLGYFMRVEDLVDAVASSPAQSPVAFVFVLVATLILFVNFTWFREQLCIVVCPYGRLQGALYDADTVLVGYDEKRGEPRGPAHEQGAGDCVDCYRCVSVCPTGIDIRNGTQLECVGCANCIDACDEVMVKLGRPKGLVRYDSQRGFETGKRRFLRGRVVLYAVLLLLGLGVMSFAVTKRHPFEASLQRAPGMPYQIEGERLHSVFDLYVINKRSGARDFKIAARPEADVQVLVAMPEVQLESLKDVHIPVHVFVDKAKFAHGMVVEIEVSCDEGEQHLVRVAKGTLLGPSTAK